MIIVLLITFLFCHWSLTADPVSQEDLKERLKCFGVQPVSYVKKYPIQVYKKGAKTIVPEEIENFIGTLD